MNNAPSRSTSERRSGNGLNIGEVAPNPVRRTITIPIGFIAVVLFFLWWWWPR